MARYVKCFRDFSGGLSEAANDNMADNQLTEAKNIVPGHGFGISRSPGVTLAFPRIPTGGSIRFLLRLTPVEGAMQTLAFVAVEEKAALYRLSGQSWALVEDGLLPPLDWFLFGGKLYWLTGKGIKCYDGSKISDLQLTPAGSSATEAEQAVWEKVCRAVAVEQRGQRWFYATDSNEVIFSGVGDPAAIGAANIINVNTKDDDSITALREFNNGLLIFKRQSVHYLEGYDFQGGSDIRLSALNVTCGTMFPHTVCTTENGVLYLGANGVYRLYVPNYSTIVAASHISEHRISEALFRYGQPDDAYAVVYENVYHLTVCNKSQGELIREYRYYPSLEAFFGEYTVQATCYSIFGDRLYMGMQNGRSVYRDKASYHYIDPATGGRVPIPVSAVTKGYDIAAVMAQQVRLSRVMVAARQYQEQSSHVDVEIRADYFARAYRLSTVSMDESLVYGEGVYADAFWGWKDTVTKQLDADFRATRVSFCFRDETLDEPLLVYGVAAVYKKRRVRGERLGVRRTAVEYRT